MRTKTVYSRINFLHPFFLKGVNAVQPAGSYSIETRSRHDWTFPITWEKKTWTTIRVCLTPGLEGRLEDFNLDPRDLFDALRRDKLSASASMAL